MSFTGLHQLRSIAREAFGVSTFIFKGFCVLQLTRNYLFQFAFLTGPSMIPTFDLTGNLVIVDRISHRRGNLVPGDVVFVRSPETPTKIVCKRLIGMEGDHMVFNSDPRNTDDTQSVIVPKGHVWVQGDNVYDSRDSRQFGAVPYALLQGKAFWKVLPLKDFGPL